MRPRRPRRVALGSRFRGPARVDLDRDDTAVAAGAGGDLAALDPRPSTKRSRICSPGPGSSTSTAAAGAALRRQLAGGDQRRHRLADPAGDDDHLRRRQRPGTGGRTGLDPASASFASAASRAASGSSPGRTVARIATSAGWLAAARSERVASGPSCSHHIRASQSGAESATAAASGVESSSSSAARRPSRSRARPAQDRVDEARRMRCLRRLGQLDRLVDSGVVGGAVGEEELVEAEPQRRQDGRVEEAGRAVGEAFDRRVEGAAALDRAVGEALRLGALTALQPALLGPGAEGALGEGLFLEGGPQHRRRRAPGPGRCSRRRLDQRQARRLVAAQVVGGGHRATARRLHLVEAQGAVAGAEEELAVLHR